MSRGANGTVLRQVNHLFRFGSHAALTDRQLLDRCAQRRGEEAEAAFAALVARHGPMVRGVGRRLLRDDHAADDVFQAVFLVLARKAASIRLATDGSLGPWLHGVTYRIARRTGRLRARETLKADAAPEAIDDHGISDLERAEQLAALHEELGRLPEKYRMPVVLCHLEGLTHEEAARRLGWPLGTVKGRLSRARSRLRDRLSRRGVTPSIALIAAWLARESNAMMVPLPLSLADATARTMLAFLSRASLAATAAGTFPASAAALADGALKTMTLSTLGKFAALGLLTLGLATGGAFALNSPDQDRDAPTDNAPPRSGQSDPDPIAAPTADADPAPSPASDVRPKLEPPGLEGPRTVAMHEETPYRLWITNSGNAPAKAVVVAFRWPEGGEPLPLSDTRAIWNGKARTIYWRLDDLDPGQSAFFDVVLRWSDSGPRALTGGVKAEGIKPIYSQFVIDVQVRHLDIDIKDIVWVQDDLFAALPDMAADHPSRPADVEPSAVSDAVRQARQDQERAIRTMLHQLEANHDNLYQSIREMERMRRLLDARRENLESRRAKILKEIGDLSAELRRLSEADPSSGEPVERPDAPE